MEARSCPGEGEEVRLVTTVDATREVSVITTGDNGFRIITGVAAQRDEAARRLIGGVPPVGRSPNRHVVGVEWAGVQ